MKSIANITLVENSTAGNPPKTFDAQTVEITHEADTVVRGVDGRTSIGHHPATIFWLGGTAKNLAGITNVKIVGPNGDVLVDGELNTTFGVPSDVTKGVKFFVLKAD
jgi:hypothetical protein